MISFSPVTERAEAIFISDLHLHPANTTLLSKFKHFIAWARSATRSIYILGDFFDAWPGDDLMLPWSEEVAKALKDLTKSGIKIYFLPGNRDFLSGEKFAQLAGWKVLPSRHVIELGGETILLAHGDEYCTKDRTHAWFRRLTRNKLFISLFQSLPRKIRQRLVYAVRQHSQNTFKPAALLAIDSQMMLREMAHYQVTKIIHGHIHQPGLTQHPVNDKIFEQYVLSDWDDKPHILCYHKTNSFSFFHFQR